MPKSAKKFYPDDLPMPRGMNRDTIILKPFVVVDKRRAIITSFVSPDLAHRYAVNWARQNERPCGVVQMAPVGPMTVINSVARKSRPDKPSESV